ncbi:MAG: hypothetical protein O7J95_20620 [Planctomycetota bacterium]|nr:hypothetical protein [Planctomycetota bacterium]
MRRRKGPALELGLIFALVSVAGFTILGAWFYVDSRSRQVEPQAEERGSGDRLTLELLARLEETRRQLATKEIALRDLEKRLTSTTLDEEDGLEEEDGARLLEELLRQIAKLSATQRRLESGRNAYLDIEVVVPDGWSRPPREEFLDEELLAALDDPEYGESGLPPDDRESARYPVDTRPPSAPRTEVAAVSQPVETRSSKEIRQLVDKLLAVVDEYATPATSREDLEPFLEEISLAAGIKAVKGLLSVHHHARDLLGDIDRNVDFLKRRNDALLRDAKKMSRKRQASGPKRYGRRYGYRGSNPELESKQRFLELSEKKIEIKAAQRGRLVELRTALLDAVSSRTDRESARYLAHHCVSEKDQIECHALLKALRAAGEPSVVPILARKLGTLDKELKKEVRATLEALTGTDLGERRTPWEKWWKERPRKQP